MVKALILSVFVAVAGLTAGCEAQGYDTSGRAGAVGTPGVGGGFYAEDTKPAS